MKNPCTLCFLVFSFCLNLSFAQKKEPVSIIVIMADQLRFDVLENDLTPNIQALRDDGVSFNRTYCASPICVPSRGSFFTGLYPNKSGSMINGWEEEDKRFSLVKKGTPNLYSVMGKNWDSWHVGKQHFFTAEGVDGPSSATQWITQKEYRGWLKERDASYPGGDKFRAMVPETLSGKYTHTRTLHNAEMAVYEDGLENFLDHYIGNKSVEAIKMRVKGKPLLLNTTFLAPHPPFHIPEPYFSMFDKVEIKLPENVAMWYPAQSPLQL